MHWDKAGAVYIKLANCHLKLERKHEAASAYVEVANYYKKTSIQEAISCLNNAVNFFLEIGRLNMAAGYCKLAKKGEQFLDLLYAVEGMDVSFSGILSYIEANAVEKLKNNECTPADLSYSLQNILVEGSGSRRFNKIGVCNMDMKEMCHLERIDLLQLRRIGVSGYLKTW